MNKRILLSSVSIFASVALVAGATFAFFSDTETSEGNTFTAGGVDLQIDYDCYYNKEADGNPNCPWSGIGITNGSWTETDLGVEHKFFDFDDIKPGDFGEGTVSLHVIDNDAWARIVINDIVDDDNTCTEPEDPVDSSCGSGLDGELRENLQFRMWLDQGSQPGFQGKFSDPGGDLGEGNNIQDNDEPTLITQGTIDEGGEIHVAADAFAFIHDNPGGTIAADCSTDDDDLEGDGHADGTCPGLTQDGHFVGSITYYLGVDWELPGDVGNEVQSDIFGADIAFEVEQYRNNPSPSFTPI